jgi:hypothetical protein
LMAGVSTPPSPRPGDEPIPGALPSPRMGEGSGVRATPPSENTPGVNK